MLSKTAEYALRVVVFLGSRQKGPASADLLAKQTKIPRRYLHRVLQDLIAAALMSSRSGPGGGYELSLPPNKIAILDVINAVSPIERIEVCPLGLKTHKSLCPLHRELDRVSAAAEESFKKITIQELLDSSSPSKPLCELS